MATCGGGPLETLQRFVSNPGDCAIQPIVELIGDGLSGLFDLLIAFMLATPHPSSPDGSVGKPESGIWKVLWETSGEEMIPIALMVAAVALLLVIIADNMLLLDNRKEVYRRVLFAFLLIGLYRPLVGMLLRFADALTMAVAPSQECAVEVVGGSLGVGGAAGIGAFLITTGASGIGPTIGLLIGGAIAIVTLIYITIVFIRWLSLYTLFFFMPVVISLWAFGIGPLDRLSKMASGYWDWFVALAFMNLPAAAVLRVGCVLSESQGTWLPGLLDAVPDSIVGLMIGFTVIIMAMVASIYSTKLGRGVSSGVSTVATAAAVGATSGAAAGAMRLGGVNTRAAMKFGNKADAMSLDTSDAIMDKMGGVKDNLKSRGRDMAESTASKARSAADGLRSGGGSGDDVPREDEWYMGSDDVGFASGESEEETGQTTMNDPTWAPKSGVPKGPTEMNSPEWAPSQSGSTGVPQGSTEMNNPEWTPEASGASEASATPGGGSQSVAWADQLTHGKTVDIPRATYHGSINGGEAHQFEDWDGVPFTVADSAMADADALSVGDSYQLEELAFVDEDQEWEADGPTGSHPAWAPDFNPHFRGNEVEPEPVYPDDADDVGLDVDLDDSGSQAGGDDVGTQMDPDDVDTQMDSDDSADDSYDFDLFDNSDTDADDRFDDE